MLNPNLKTDPYQDFLARYDDVQRIEVRRGIVLAIMDGPKSQQMYLDLYKLQTWFDTMGWCWSTKEQLTLIIEPDETTPL